MSVMRNTFSGELSASPNLSTSYKTHAITGLTSETSTTNVNYMNPEASLHFLNAMHKTLVDAGYGDAVKNETEYSITVLGFKFFVFIVGNNSIYPMIYTISTTNCIYSSQSYHINGNQTDIRKNLEYNITVRGDSNHVSVYFGSYNAPTTEIGLLSIAKGKNLVTSSDIYLFGPSISINTSNGVYMCEKDNPYSYFFIGYNPLNLTTGGSGLNTNSKFVCVPQLAYYNTCLFYSMIQGNSAVFTSGKYYKIGNEIYYNENGYLYKVG